MFKPVAIGLALAALTGAAHAEAAKTRLVLDLSRRPVATRPIQSSALEAAVLPRTAVRYSLAPDATGRFGFLCGREPGQTRSGSAGAFGSDPHGRFVGARLSRAF